MAETTTSEETEQNLENSSEISYNQHNFTLPPPHSPKRYGSVGRISPDVSSTSTSSWITKLSCAQLPPFLFQSILFVLLPLWIWLSSFVIVGQDALPGGSVFVIVLLACGGRIIGYAFALVSLPPMLGMLGLGLVIRNVPYVDYGKNLDPTWSSPIRQIALAVILTRGGLGLDLGVLRKLKSLIFRFAIFPTTTEALAVTLIGYFLLNFPWPWAILLGFVLAPVSPAVVVPRLLQLKADGYGVDKGIPIFIIAAACLDNVFAISCFGVCLNFVFPTSNLTFSILQGPLQVVIGISFGLLWGFFLGTFFNQNQTTDSTLTFLRLVLTFCGGVISVLGLSKLGYSGAGALGCLLSSFTASCLWRLRKVITGQDPVAWGFYVLWYIFEPLLFGVIGTQIDILSLDLQLVQLGVATIFIGVGVRLIVAFLAVTRAQLNLKEKIFAAIAWSPKATVQAAIGPIALDMAVANGNDEDKIMGEKILTLAVLSILLTSAVGELGVMLTGPRFLTKTQILRKNSAP